MSSSSSGVNWPLCGTENALVCLHLCVRVRLTAPCACVSHVQYLLPEYLARGAVCRLNKGSQSPALKRTFIKHFRSLHLFLLAKTDKLGRLRRHITPEGARCSRCSQCFSH